MQDLLLLNEIIYRPIFNLLIIFLELFQGYLGLAIIAITLLIRTIMIKQTSAQQDMQQGMSDMQPKLQEIQEKYKDDPVRMQKEMMNTLKTKGKGPLKGCLMMIIQIPVFIGLFYVIRNYASNTVNPDAIYSFLYNFGQKFINIDLVNTHFLGMDLLKTGKDFDVMTNQNLYLAIFAGVFTFFQMKLTNLVKPAAAKMPGGAKAPDMGKMMKFMGIFMAFMIGSFVYSMQLGVGLYIATTTLFSTLQYSIQYRKLLKAKLAIFFKGKHQSSKPEIIDPNKS